MDFIRRHIKCLLDYWLPESMQRNPIIYVFLTEILSVHVFEPMINSYSDFTSINEAIVDSFDDNPATQQKEDSGKQDKILHGSTSDESYPIRESDDITSRKVPKKERKGFGKKFKGVFKRRRPKRSETEAEPMFRSCSAAMNSDVGDIVDTGSTDDSEDEENPMTSIIDTSLQMWIKKNWTATVSEGLVEKEDEYEISVYDESSPDVVLWKTKRRVQDFEFMYKKIYQKYPDFTTSTKPKTTGRPTDADGQFFHSIGISPDEFIKILVDFLKKYEEREAVFFFSPFHYKDDENQYLKFLPNTVGEHLSEQSNTDDELPGDFSSSEMESDNSGTEFRTLNTQNEEEKCNRVTDNKSSPTDLQDTDNAGASDRSKCKGDELLLDSCDKESDSKEVYQADGFKSPRSRKKNKKYQSASHSEREDMSSTDVTGKEEFPSENADRANFFNIQRPNIMDSYIQKSSQNVVGFTSQGTSQTVEQQKMKLQKTLLDVLYQLTDEVLAGGNSVVLFLHNLGFLQKFNKTILDFIPNIFAEEQVIWYLKQVAELLMSPVPPQQLPPDVLQSKALDILKNKVRGLMPRALKFLENWIMKNLKASHQALQDPLANKETIYGMLEDLTKIITDEGGIFNPLTVH